MNLFEFTGKGATRYLTNNKLPVTVGTNTYQPYAIQRSTYRLDPLKTKTNMSILLPGDDAWGRELILPNDYIVFLKIKSLSGNTFWSGKLLEVGIMDNRKIKLVFRPLETVKGIAGERRRFQHNCPYVLYGDKCGATVRYDTVEVINFDQDTRKVTVDIATPRANNPSYIGGIFTTDTGSGKPYWIVQDVFTRIRRIFTFYQHELTLLGPLPPELNIGITVFIAPGCNRTIDDCGNVHSNIGAYGGFWSMDVSPFDSSVRG